MKVKLTRRGPADNDADPADDPNCQRLRIGAHVIIEALRRRGASHAEIEREIADLAREMERSGST